MSAAIRKYKVIEHSHYFTRDETVYEYTGHDYGLVRDATELFGTECMAVTAYDDGQAPFATIEKVKLKLVE
jgi:hypothetical protein